MSRPCARIVRSTRRPASVPAFMLGLVASRKIHCCEVHAEFWGIQCDVWRTQLMSAVALFTAGEDPEPLSGAWS